jgi:hypothetical protein
VEKVGDYLKVYSNILKIKVMEVKAETDNQVLARVLKNELAHVDKLWEDKEMSHAYIIGYLTGLVKTAIEELEK